MSGTASGILTRQTSRTGRTCRTAFVALAILILAGQVTAGIPILGTGIERPYIGLGVRLEPQVDEEGYVRIAEILPQARRDVRRGLKAGDRITHVDGRAVKGLDSDALIQLIRGPEGERVKLQVLRRGVTEPRTVIVKRRRIEGVTSR